MKTLLIKTMVLAGLMSFFGCKSPTDPSTWNSKQIDTWFDKGEWLNGWNVKPDASINRKEFAVSYFKHKERWDKAFAFMKDTDLKTIDLNRHDIDDDNIYALPSEYMTKNEEEARYEDHQRYIDLQYVVSGKELIGIAPVSTRIETLQPYDTARDISFLSVSKIVNYKADSTRFFLFFPDDAHRPGLRDGESIPVRKVVLKIKVD